MVAETALEDAVIEHLDVEGILGFAESVLTDPVDGHRDPRHSDPVVAPLWWDHAKLLRVAGPRKDVTDQGSIFSEFVLGATRGSLPSRGAGPRPSCGAA